GGGGRDAPRAARGRPARDLPAAGGGGRPQGRPGRAHALRRCGWSGGIDALRRLARPSGQGRWDRPEELLLLLFVEQVVGQGLGAGHDARDVGIALRSAIALAPGLLPLHALGRLLPRPLLSRDLLLPLRESGPSSIRHWFRSLPARPRGLAVAEQRIVSRA